MSGRAQDGGGYCGYTGGAPCFRVQTTSCMQYSVKQRQFLSDRPDRNTLVLFQRSASSLRQRSRTTPYGVLQNQKNQNKRKTVEVFRMQNPSMFSSSAQWVVVKYRSGPNGQELLLAVEGDVAFAWSRLTSAQVCDLAPLGSASFSWAGYK
jgi:hypothetical protein